MGGTAPSGWIKLRNSDQDNLGSDGYFGVAYVKVVGNVATDVVVAHRGTEPTDTGDLVADIQLSLQLANHQKDDALDFLANVQTAYEALAEQGYDVDNPFSDITTHVGHSLGGWLATRTADSQGSDGVAITFDSPASGLVGTNASVTHYLNPPNWINRAGGNRVGTVYELESDRTFGNDTKVASMANFLAGFADLNIALLNAPTNIITLI